MIYNDLFCAKLVIFLIFYIIFLLFFHNIFVGKPIQTIEDTLFKYRQDM